MTTVAISLSEMRRFHPSPQGRNRARRCLFGSVDHQETQRLLHRELDRITRQDSRRWNFDFTNESPLPGRYAWEPVTDESVPAATYSLARLPSLNQASSSEPSPATASARTEEEETRTAPIVASTSSATSANESSSKTKQTRMTDFLPSRKRKTVSEVSKSVETPSTPTPTTKKTRLT